MVSRAFRAGSTRVTAAGWAACGFGQDEKTGPVPSTVMARYWSRPSWPAARRSDPEPARQVAAGRTPDLQPPSWPTNGPGCWQEDQCPGHARRGLATGHRTYPTRETATTSIRDPARCPARVVVAGSPPGCWPEPPWPGRADAPGNGRDQRTRHERATGRAAPPGTRSPPWPPDERLLEPLAGGGWSEERGFCRDRRSRAAHPARPCCEPSWSSLAGLAQPRGVWPRRSRPLGRKPSASSGSRRTSCCSPR